MGWRLGLWPGGTSRSLSHILWDFVYIRCYRNKCVCRTLKRNGTAFNQHLINLIAHANARLTWAAIATRAAFN